MAFLAGDLRDRFELRALVAVAIQALVLLVVLVYGFSTIGWRMLLPSLAMVGAFAALGWLTLTRPWDFTGWEYRTPQFLSRGYWEPGFVYGPTLSLAYLHFDVISDMRERTREAMMRPDDPLHRILAAASDASKDWMADTYGALAYGLPFTIALIFAPLFVLALSWFMLPR